MQVHFSVIVYHKCGVIDIIIHVTSVYASPISEYRIRLILISSDPGRQSYSTQKQLIILGIEQILVLLTFIQNRTKFYRSVAWTSFFD